MKSKYQMFKELLKNGVTKEQIKSKNFQEVVFKIDFSEWNFRILNFSFADFRSADFSFADFRSADFSSADFSFADFSSANFRSADFRSANFRFANFSFADFSFADFRSADFSSADFSSANFSIKINECTIGLVLACPEEGSFIAWKKCKNNVIVKLQICEHAKRSSATTLKCRASKALVLDIEGGLSQIESQRTDSFIYVKGEIVEVKNFDENRWNECSSGIHFFMSRELAKQY